MGEVLGAVVEGFGAKAEADAAKDAAKFREDIAREESGQEQERIRELARIQLGENITRVAKSGVRLEGSPLEVLAKNAENTEKQMANVRRDEFIKGELARAAQKNAEIAGNLGIARSAVKVAGSLISFGVRSGAGSGGHKFGSAQRAVGTTT